MSKQRATLCDINWGTSSRLMIPWCTISNTTTKACWTNGPPEGALKYVPPFSSMVCGAWSVAITSILPSKTPLRISSLSAADFTAGFHLMKDPLVLYCSSVNQRWWMQASAVIRFCSIGMSFLNKATSFAVEMCRMCKRVLNFSANSTAIEEER